MDLRVPQIGVYDVERINRKWWRRTGRVGRVRRKERFLG